MFRLQEQISTGLRINLPSQDAPAALRAIGFQRLLSRNEQFEANINSGLLFLGNTDSTLSGADGVSGVLSRIRADTLGVVGTDATDQQRETAIANINGALDQLVTLANRQFNGRFLFGGSQSDSPPYEFSDGSVRYSGDDRELQNFSAIGVLFSSSISGQEVFGGISEAVVGSVDLNPQTTADTLLSTLRGGRGINANGSLLIGDASTNESSIVDLSSATTLGDVARLIEDNPPSGSSVNVTITGNGLQVTLAGGNLTIAEVGTATTATELGLLNDQTPGDSETITGEDLDPQFLRTTRLDDLLGSRATARLATGGTDNDILIEADTNGTSLNGVSFEVLDGGSLGAAATVNFDSGSNTLQIFVDEDGLTTTNDIIEAINADASLNFTASLDLGDSSSLSGAGTGEIPIGSTFGGVNTSGGSGENFDQDAGIRVINGGETFDFQFTEDQTVEDLLNRLNRSDAGLEATINDAGTGLVIRSRLSGGDFQIGELGGQTATQLGIRTFTADSLLDEFNFGVGVPTADANEFTLTNTQLTFNFSDGTDDGGDPAQLLTIDISAARNANDVIAIINADPLITTLVTARSTLDENGNPTDGITFTDETTGTGRLSIIQSGDELSIQNGVPASIPAIDFNVTVGNGSTIPIDVSSADNVGDVLDLINNHRRNDNGSGGQLVRAQLAESGNGIELVDLSGGTNELSVTRVSSSQAAEFLGLVGANEQSNGSSTGTLTGIDRNSVENESVFNTLIRLRDALEANDLTAISRAHAQLDVDIERVTFAQADVGTRFQNLELSQFTLQDEQIQLQAALSEEIDVDLVQAISELTARQLSFEASLRAAASALQLSILDFI